MIYAEDKPSAKLTLILLVVAIVSRFYGIWEWDLVDDEYFTATKAYEAYRSYVNPAYYNLVVLMYEMLGPKEWHSRIPAFILAVVSIPVFYFTWSRAIGKNVALFATIILLFSAWHLWYSQFARYYSGVFLFSSLAYFFFFRGIFIDKIGNLIWAMIFSLLAVLFHVTAIFVPASVAAAYLLILIFQKDNEAIAFRNIKYFLIGSIIAVIFLIPVLLGVLREWVSSGESWGYGGILILPQLIKYIQIPIVVAGFFGWIVLARKDKAAMIFFFVTLLVPAVFFVIASPFMAISPSYAYYILPLVVLLAGMAFEEVRRLVSSQHSLLVSVFPFVLLVATLSPSFASHYLEKSSLNFNSVVSFVDENFEDGDRILSFKPGFELPDEKEFTLLPFISFERDSSTDWNRELQSFLETDNRTWILVSSKRKPIAKNLENWLFCHARLVWQKHATRVDYEVNGYQIFLVTNERNPDVNLDECKS